MGIDWFTVGAQAFNFIVLVWLLKRFLYKPILQAIDAREGRIAAELADADATKAEALQERATFRHKNAEMDQERGELMRKATDEAEAERARLVDEARKQADTLTGQWQATLAADARNLSQAIARRTQREIFAIARKALADLAGTSLEERLSDVFTHRLRELDGNAKAIMVEAVRTAREPAVVRSAFELSAQLRTAIANAINETCSVSVEVRFETTPELISGIELAVNGRRLAWSIADYLASLEGVVAELLDEKGVAPIHERSA